MTSSSDLAERWLDVAAAGSVTAKKKIERARGGAGRVAANLKIEPGVVVAVVPEGRGRSHRVRLSIEVVEPARWDELAETLGAKLRYTADLLEGHLPTPAAVELMPDLIEASCPCGQPLPCRHVAGAHQAVAVALTRDPLVLLSLHGHRREDLLDAVRASRSTADPDDEVDLTDPLAARGDLDAIDVHPVPTPDVELLFQQLGNPPGIDPPDPVAKLMADAAELAWKLAAGEGSDTADDEVLLTELRAQSVATAEALADSLGLDAEGVRAALDRLYDEGQVLRMGSGEGARYRAA